MAILSVNRQVKLNDDKGRNAKFGGLHDKAHLLEVRSNTQNATFASTLVLLSSTPIGQKFVTLVVSPGCMFFGIINYVALLHRL